MSTMKKAKQKIKSPTSGIKVLLTFLKLTKEGKYATIEKSSIPYSRLQQETETNTIEEQYHYGLS